MDYSVIERMLSEFSNGASIHDLCTVLAGAVGNPVAVATPAETLMGYSSDFDREFIEEFTTSAKYMSQDEMADMHSSFDAILCTGQPHMQAWPYLRHKQINCGCLYKGVLMGAMLIPLPHAPKVDFDTIGAAARILGIWLATNGYFINKCARPEQNFLMALLQGDIDAELQRGNLSDFFFTGITSFRAIWILPDGAPSSAFQARIAKLCKRAKRWWHIAYEQGYVVLLDAKCDAYFDELARLLEATSATACISDEYTSVAETKTHLKMLRSVMGFRSAYSDACDPLFFANSYKLMTAVSYSKNRLAHFLFTNETLSNIIEYDAQNSSFYLETLRVFFHENRDYKKMAESLGIHKNSVFYRMNRLCELFNIDFSNEFQSSSLFYALLIHDGII